MSDRRIVVTGLGLICALGDGTDKCWSAASNGITGIREVQSVSTEGCYANKGAEVAESSEQLSGEDYDRSSLLCIKAAGEALADAGYTVTADNSDRIGVIVGNCVGGGMMISPGSLVDDGKLRVVIVNKVPKWRIPQALLSFLNGKILSLPFVSEYICEEADFTTDFKPVLNADGELLRADRFDCRIVKAGIRIYRRRGDDVGSKARN